ncbi:hypothetical protein [Brasilonema sp. UFV-L1]|uniref:hypothetical protein n=1 Tax=Brasilonema sp. UFV-L1 TaxID=2234130 RepID=UPI00403FC0E4
MLTLAVSLLRFRVGALSWGGWFAAFRKHSRQITASNSGQQRNSLVIEAVMEHLEKIISERVNAHTIIISIFVLDF